MATSSGWDPGRSPGLPPSAIDGKPTAPVWMGGVGIGQLQILSLRAIDDTKELCPFVVGKSMSDLVGEIEDTNTEAGGNKYVLRVRDARQVTKLLGMKELFDGTAIVVEHHPILNKRRCVISCREIKKKSEQELLEWMSPQGVIGVKRITRLVDGKVTNTPTIILTINGTAVPEHVKVGPLRIRTRIYVPDPMLCYRCYSFGHTKFRCKEVARCRNCSNSHDMSEECTAAPFCRHCQQSHGPASRSCSVYQAEKEITRLRFTKNISDEEARKQFAAGGGSYADVSKVQQRLTVARDTTSNSEELKAKDDLIKQLMDTIAKLTARIDEMELRGKQKKEKKRSKKAAKIKEQDSASDMETDNSSLQSEKITASQVSASTSKPTQKRLPTTEMSPPIVKKSFTQPLPRLPLDPQNGNSTMKLPAKLNEIIEHLQNSQDSLRNNPSNSQPKNGQQQQKPKK